MLTHILFINLGDGHGAKTDDGRVSRAMTQCRLLLLGGGNPYVKIDSGQNGTKFTDCLKFFNMFVIVFIQRFRENRRGTVSSHQTLMRGRTYL